MVHSLLGALDPTAFLQRHWQKRPHFVRGALPDCGDWADRAALFEWSTRDDVESRLVMQTRGRWSVRQGPFRAAELKRLPQRGWSLLVQGVEQLNPQAAALLQHFSFVPHARLDDLMVSYAPPGGGVGPHFDSYDVFLLQGPGTRRWRISTQYDRALVENAPLRILKRFRATREWICEQGDLLYLPPRCAHEGVAIDGCITLSVGFRAPQRQELATHFLDFLRDELTLSGIYQDPDLQPQKHPAAISSGMLRKLAHMLQGIRWSHHDIRRFCGQFLTEPKAHLVFARPSRALPLTAFGRRVATAGVRLAPATRLLFCGRDLFINGEHHRMPDTAAATAAFTRLADQRRLPASALSRAALQLLHTWYRTGYIEV